MAIDTEEKRLSLLSFGRPGFTLPLPATPDRSRRRHLLGLYAGDQDDLFRPITGAGVYDPTITLRGVYSPTVTLAGE